MYSYSVPVVLIVFVVGTLIWGFCFARPRANMEEKMEEEEAARERKQEILDCLQDEAHEAFGIELDTVHESATQDEIVRMMNLLAIKTATECVNYDKQVRGVLDCSWNYKGGSARLKHEWSETRKLALRICPELASRLPHFSEFEPLKSYREKHIQEKARKKSAA